MASSLFILGGARSGKSRFAVAEQPLRGRVAFVATAQPGDGDMARRIARHQAERPRHWTTVEAPYDLVARLTEVEAQHDAIVVDCLTLWVSNRLLRGDGDDAILDEAEALGKLIER
ncbi:MAG: bifunctional adenosylcobinamide kinase/adenosylcobinamide-phosphate guanylyltransferase, partial [Candidatus Rokubacteria bacterium]|nr:bifunctional adenosylcobinamide kinase/adenosylcobinamide-phosphate guanylyltransferase [Candidatus Rokubacteria bacterium]